MELGCVLQQPSNQITVQEYFSDNLLDSGVTVKANRIRFSVFRQNLSRLQYQQLMDRKPVKKFDLEKNVSTPNLV